MPNWVNNKLLIHGDAQPMLESIKGTDTPFDFNRVVPMPPELAVEGGTKADIALLCADGNGIGRYAEYQWVKEAGITTPQGLCHHFGFLYEDMVTLGKRLLNNVKQSGHRDWYGWRCDNWGTKWNACDPELVVLQGCYGVLFDTAWAPPVEGVIALGNKFPETEMSLTWTESMNLEAGLIRARGEQGIFKPVEMAAFKKNGEPFDFNKVDEPRIVCVRPLEDLDALALSWRGPCECKKCKNTPDKQHSLN